MDIISKNAHWISHFPERYPFYKKLFANLIFFITGIIIHPRKNQLNHFDLIKARLLLRKGDVVLWGNLREVATLFIHGPSTHASIYLGRRKFVEAVFDGVQINILHHFFTQYDTMIILRLPKKTKKKRKIIKLAIHHALEQVGKPYDFDFSGRSNKFFCSELVNYAYLKAKHNTKLRSIGRFKKSQGLIRKMILASRALHPISFAEKGNFDIVYVSHNLDVKKKITLKEK